MTTIDKPKSKIIELHGRYEIYYCFLSKPSKKKADKKEKDYILADIHINPREVIPYNKNLDKLNYILNDNTESFDKALANTVEKEKRLANNHIDIFKKNKTTLYKISVLCPIIDNTDQEPNYLFPIVYHFTDNRKIFKFTFDFNENSITDYYSINKNLSGTYYFEKEHEQFNKKSISEKQSINHIFSDIYEKYFITMSPITNLDFQNTPLYETAYILKLKLDNFSEKEHSAWLNHLVLFPNYTNISKKYTENFIESNGLEMYVTPNKTFLSVTKQLEQTIKYNCRNMNESDSENIYFTSASTFYPMLFKIILKKYKLFFLGKNELDLSKIMKKKKKDLKYSYIFTITETNLTFANYDSVSKLSYQIESLIIPEYISSQMNELDYYRKNYEEESINSYIEQNNNFLALVTLFLSIALSYTPIKEVLIDLKIKEYSFLAYLLFQIVLIVVYITYRKIIKWRN